MIQVGCSGFAGSHREYARAFRVVEIQETFYNLPNLNRAKKWREELGPRFQFTMKAPLLITHEAKSPVWRRLKSPPPAGRMGLYGSFQDNRAVMAVWNQTAAFAARLGAKAVLFQCPATFGPTPENIERLDAFFSQLRVQDRPCAFALEVRGDWTPESVGPVAERHQLIHAVDPLTQEAVPGQERIYFRLHGRTFRYRFRRKDHDEILEKVRTSGAEEGWVFFNNITMADDARRFQQLLYPKGMKPAKPAPSGLQTPAAARPARESEEAGDDWD